LEGHVDGFRNDKTSKTDVLFEILSVLFEILSVLLEAGLSVADQRATLAEYTLYIDIITSKSKNAEQRGLEAGVGGEQVRRGESEGQRKCEEDAQPGGSQEKDAKHLLQQICKEHLHKRRRSESDLSSSGDDSTLERRNGVSNKKQ
jgi:hypothetical protein